MSELLTQKQLQVVLSLVLLTGVVVVAYYIIASVRRAISTSDTGNNDLASDFKEMRLEGDIDEEELRSITAVLEKTQTKR